MLDWLESTAIARMVQESLWGYPIILSGHAIGMAVLVGIVLMIDLRVLGFAPGIPLSSLRPMFRFAMIGLVINVISGSMLFMANAGGFFESNPFRIKIVLLVIGATLLVVMSRQISSGNGAARDGAVGPGARGIAGVSIAVWIGVIVAGRLIAYIDVGFY